MQLRHLELQDEIEISFMFRTSSRQALLLYMHDSPNSYYYVSLALVDGMLDLSVYPDISIGLSRNGDKTVMYNDTKWHSVSILVTQDKVNLHIDDYYYEKVCIYNIVYNVYHIAQRKLN